MGALGAGTCQQRVVLRGVGLGAIIRPPVGQHRGSPADGHRHRGGEPQHVDDDDARGSRTELFQPVRPPLELEVE
jgi:hypothetical protein